MNKRQPSPRKRRLKALISKRITPGNPVPVLSIVTRTSVHPLWEWSSEWETSVPIATVLYFSPRAPRSAQDEVRLWGRVSRRLANRSREANELGSKTRLFVVNSRAESNCVI